MTSNLLCSFVENEANWMSLCTTSLIFYIDKLQWIKLEDAPLLSTSSAPTAIAKCKQAVTEMGSSTLDADLAVLDKLGEFLTSDSGSPPQGTYELFGTKTKTGHFAIAIASITILLICFLVDVPLDRILLEGNAAKLFPCLFIFRLVILRRVCADHYALHHGTCRTCILILVEKLFAIMTRILAESMSKGVLLMGLTTASNLFASYSGTQFATKEPTLSLIASAAVKSLNSSESSLRSVGSCVARANGLRLQRQYYIIIVSCCPKMEMIHLLSV